MKNLNSLKSWIGQNKTENVLKYLNSNTEKLSDETSNKLVLISSRYYDWKGQFNSHLLRIDESSIIINKIRHDLIQFIDEIKDVFTKIVEPLFQQMILIHEDWVNSFVKYRTILNKEILTGRKLTRFDFAILRNLIVCDSDNSRRTRIEISNKSKLLEEYFNLSILNQRVKDYMGTSSWSEKMKDFHEISRLMEISKAEHLAIEEMDQICVRADFYNLIKEDDLTTSSTIKTATEKINEILQELHEKYELFEFEYLKLNMEYQKSV